jgi:hypothetical protein
MMEREKAMKSFLFSTLILASMTAGALAGSPVQLTNAEMDKVSAGAVGVGASSGAQTGGAVAAEGNNAAFLVQPGLLQIGPCGNPCAGVGVR